MKRLFESLAWYCASSQDRSQSRVVCACPQQAETKDSVVCHLSIGVMAELAQSVQDGHLRVRYRDQSEGKRDGAADDGLTVPHQVTQGPDQHLAADVLSHRDQPKSKDSHSLLPGKIKWTLFFLFLVFSLLVPILLLPVLFVVLLPH